MALTQIIEYGISDKGNGKVELWTWYKKGMSEYDGFSLHPTIEDAMKQARKPAPLGFIKTATEVTITIWEQGERQSPITVNLANQVA